MLHLVVRLCVAAPGDLQYGIFGHPRPVVRGLSGARFGIGIASHPLDIAVRPPETAEGALHSPGIQRTGDDPRQPKILASLIGSLLVVWQRNREA